MAKWAERELERDVIRKERESIKSELGAIAAERAARRRRLEQAAQQCAAGLAQHQLERKQRREALARQLDEERSQVRGACAAGRDVARQAPKLEQHEAKLDELRRDKRSRRIWEHPDPLKRSGRGASSKPSREKQSESDDEVRNNIPRELWPVFERYREKFKASDRRSRTEAFEEWAAEHPSLVREALDAAIAELPPEEDEESYYARLESRSDEKRPAAMTRAKKIDFSGPEHWTYYAGDAWVTKDEDEAQRVLAMVVPTSPRASLTTRHGFGTYVQRDGWYLRASAPVAMRRTKKPAAKKDKPSMSYEQWTYAVREHATDRSMHYGSGLYDAWLAGADPKAFAKSLPFAPGLAPKREPVVTPESNRAVLARNDEARTQALERAYVHAQQHADGLRTLPGWAVGTVEFHPHTMLAAPYYNRPHFTVTRPDGRMESRIIEPGGTLIVHKL